MDDTLRHAMYLTEAHVHITYGIDDDLTAQELRKLADKARSSPWWRENAAAISDLSIRLHHTADSESWFGSALREANIRLGPGESHLGMLCHELAHIACGGDDLLPEHSIAWLATYCSLLRLFGQPIAAARMWHELLPYFEKPEWNCPASP